MSFVCEDIGKLPSIKCENTDEKRKLLNKFRDKVCSGRLVNFYSDIGSLKASVATSINKCTRDFPATGWVRGNEVPSLKDENLEAKFDEFLAKRAMTKENIDALFKEIESKPGIHIGPYSPTNTKDLWIKTSGN